MDRRRLQQSLIVAAGVIFAVLMVVVAGKIISKYTPTKEEKNLYEYYGLEKESRAAIVLNHEILEQQAVIKDGMLYLDYDTVRELFNDRFYWDGNENLLLYTTASDVITAKEIGRAHV